MHPVTPEDEASRAERDETSPLLRQPPSVSSRSVTCPHQATHSELSRRSRWYPYATIIVATFSLVADLGGALVDTPEIRLLEMGLCREYYRAHDTTVIGPPPLSYVDERFCKVNEIQSQLALLRANKFFIGMIPGILLTFFYGRLADKIGRKPVLLLGMTGQVLAIFWILIVCYFHETFPTNAVLAAPVFMFVGGGVRVVTAVMNTVVIDVTPAEMRTTVFYLIGAAVLITDIVALPVGSWLLSKDLWLPWKFSVPIILMAYPLILALPETSQASKEDATHDHSSLGQRPLEASKATYERVRNYVVERAKSVTVNKEVSVCLLITFLISFSGQAQGVFVQFASKVLDWPISKTGYVLSFSAAITLGVLIVLAGITKLLNARNFVDSLKFDIWIVRTSLTFFIAGNLLLGLGITATPLIAGKLIAACGNPIVQAMQGIIASYASDSVTGQLYASVAFVELLGGIGGNFAFAALFRAGLALETRGAIGLPFLTNAAVYGIPFLLSMLLTDKKN